MGLYDGLKLSNSLYVRISLHNLLVHGKNISILHMKNEIQTWPNLGHLAIWMELFSFSSQVFSWSHISSARKAHCKVWVQTYEL